MSRLTRVAVNVLLVAAFVVAGGKLQAVVRSFQEARRPQADIISPCGGSAGGAIGIGALTAGLAWGLVVGLLVVTGDRRSSYRRNSPRPPQFTPAERLS